MDKAIKNKKKNVGYKKSQENLLHLLNKFGNN